MRKVALIAMFSLLSLVALGPQLLHAKCGTRVDEEHLVDPSGLPGAAVTAEALNLDTGVVVLNQHAYTHDFPSWLPPKWTEKSHVTAERFSRYNETGTEDWYLLLAFTPALSSCDFLQGFEEWEDRQASSEAVTGYQHALLVFARRGRREVLLNNLSVWLSWNAVPSEFEAKVLEPLRSQGFEIEKLTWRSDLSSGREIAEITTGGIIAGGKASALSLALKLSDYKREEGEHMLAWISRVRLNFFPIESALRIRTTLTRLSRGGKPVAMYKNENIKLGINERPGLLWRVDIDVAKDTPYFFRDLYYRSKKDSKPFAGDDVAALQKLLIGAHAGPAARALEKKGSDGIFGEMTKKALAEFQARQVPPLHPDGYFGAATRTSILKKAKPSYQLKADPYQIKSALRAALRPPADDGGMEVFECVVSDAKNSVSDPRYAHIQIACRFTLSRLGEVTSSRQAGAYTLEGVVVVFLGPDGREIPLKTEKFDFQVESPRHPDQKFISDVPSPARLGALLKGVHKGKTGKASAVSSVPAAKKWQEWDKKLGRGLRTFVFTLFGLDWDPRPYTPILLLAAILLVSLLVALSLWYLIAKGQKAKKDALLRGTGYIRRHILSSPDMGYRMLIGAAVGRPWETISAQSVAEEFGRTLPGTAKKMLEGEADSLRESALDFILLLLWLEENFASWTDAKSNLLATEETTGALTNLREKMRGTACAETEHLLSLAKGEAYNARMKGDS